MDTLGKHSRPLVDCPAVDDGSVVHGGGHQRLVAQKREIEHLRGSVNRALRRNLELKFENAALRAEVDELREENESLRALDGDTWIT